jgi:hypothetical protein
MLSEDCKLISSERAKGEFLMRRRYFQVDADRNNGAGRNNADPLGMSDTEVKAGIALDFRFSIAAITEAQLASRYAKELAEYLTQLVATCYETSLVLASDEAISSCLFALC